MPPKQRADNNRVTLAKLETTVVGLERQVKENKRDNDTDHGKIFALLEKVDDRVGTVAEDVARLSGRFNGNPTANVVAETKGKLSGLYKWLPVVIMLVWGAVTLFLQMRNGG